MSDGAAVEIENHSLNGEVQSALVSKV
jgi:hypothetical protein